MQFCLPDQPGWQSGIMSLFWTKWMNSPIVLLRLEQNWLLQVKWKVILLSLQHLHKNPTLQEGLQKTLYFYWTCAEIKMCFVFFYYLFIMLYVKYLSFGVEKTSGQHVQPFLSLSHNLVTIILPEDDWRNWNLPSCKVCVPTWRVKYSFLSGSFLLFFCGT